jgi:hypothetical protein
MHLFHHAAAYLESATGLDLPVVFAVIFTFSTLLVLYTRLTTGTSGAGSSPSSKRPPSLPYWIPYFGHLFQWLIFHDETLEETK